MKERRMVVLQKDAERGESLRHLGRNQIVEIWTRTTGLCECVSSWQKMSVWESEGGDAGEDCEEEEDGGYPVVLMDVLCVKRTIFACEPHHSKAEVVAHAERSVLKENTVSWSLCRRHEGLELREYHVESWNERRVLMEKHQQQEDLYPEC